MGRLFMVPSYTTAELDAQTEKFANRIAQLSTKLASYGRGNLRIEARSFPKTSQLKGYGSITIDLQTFDEEWIYVGKILIEENDDGTITETVEHQDEVEVTSDYVAHLLQKIS